MTTKAMRQEAVLKVSKTFVRTPCCLGAKESFDKLLTLGRLAGGLCLLICGESGVGKSTLLLWLRRGLKVRRTDAGVSSPSVSIVIPTAPTAIAIMEVLLTELGDPKPSRGTRTGKRLRLLKMLREQGVMLLILDDLQHIVDRHSGRIIFDASEAIKEILIDYPMSVLCAGLPDAERVVRSNEQLSRRHMTTISVERFDWNIPKSRDAFLLTLEKFAVALDCYELPDLLDDTVAVRFYLATGGIMDFLFKIFLFAAQIALEKKLIAIDLKVFAKAWRLALLHAATGENPFYKSFDIETDLDAKIQKAKSINLPPPSEKLSKDKAGRRLARAGL